MSTSAPLFDSAFLARLEQLHLLSRRMARGELRAERRARQTGTGFEFADYREYTPGDEPRSIDWHAYGRLERLFVKLHEQERDLPVEFLVDCSASMRWTPGGGAAPHTKFDHARRLCAALAYIALANLDRVNIRFFAANTLAELGGARGKPAFHSILTFLESAPAPDGPTRLLTAAKDLRDRSRRPGLVILIGDLFDPAGCEEPLGLLLHGRFELHVVQTLAPTELEPDATGDLRLTDTETGRTIDVTASESLLRRYRAEIAAFHSGIETFCARRGIGFARTMTDAPFEEAVLRTLRDGVMIR